MTGVVNTAIVAVDYHNAQQCHDLREQLICYSQDLMGGGVALAHDVAEKSIALLREKSYAFSFLAYRGDHPVGFSNCFESVATFAGACAVNIHDLAVAPECRNQGIGGQLLHAIVDEANRRQCYKITLEVLEKNTAAMQLYQHQGFTQYQLDPRMGHAQFWQKVL